jgi:hypothetical protein
MSCLKKKEPENDKRRIEHSIRNVENITKRFSSLVLLVCLFENTFADAYQIHTTPGIRFF